jgi:hypothetical protein
VETPLPRIAARKPGRVPAGSKPTLDPSARHVGFTPNRMATVALSPIALDPSATLPGSLRKAPGLNPSRRDGSQRALFERGYGIRRFQPLSSYGRPLKGLEKARRRRVTSVTRSHLAVIMGQYPQAIDSDGRERGARAAKLCYAGPETFSSLCRPPAGTRLCAPPRAAEDASGCRGSCPLWPPCTSCQTSLDRSGLAALTGQPSVATYMFL